MAVSRRSPSETTSLDAERGRAASPTPTGQSTSRRPSRRCSRSPTSSVEGSPGSRSASPAPVRPPTPPAPILGPGPAWKRGCCIGGRVHRALYLPAGPMFALKVMEIAGGAAAAEEEERRRAIEAELRRLQTVRHPNLVRYLDCQFSGRHLFLHMEMLSGISVEDHIKTNGPILSREVPTFTLGVLRAIHYLHTRDPYIAHGNLRGSNVLIIDAEHVKLLDYGCAGFTTAGPGNAHGSQQGAALGVAEPQLADPRKADVWGIGCLLVEMATGELLGQRGMRAPGPGEAGGGAVGLWTVARRGAAMDWQRGAPSPAVLHALPTEARDLAWQCLQSREEDRPDVWELMLHRFVSG